jgi:hypothetical protein
MMLLAALLAASQAPPGHLTVSMQRTACFGTCPVYTVRIYEDGLVEYTGTRFVKLAGAQSWHIEPAAVRALVAEIDKAGFFEMRDEYTAPVTDQPTTYVTVISGGRHKSIKDYFNAPPALEEIEQRIDEVSGVLRYVKGGNEGLDAAIARGDAAAVKQLLANGADPRARDANGVTLVMKAALSGNPETVRVVVAAGGDPTARDLAGRNAADRVRDLLARDPHNQKLAEILRLLTDE